MGHLWQNMELWNIGEMCYFIRSCICITVAENIPHKDDTEVTEPSSETMLLYVPLHRTGFTQYS